MRRPGRRPGVQLQNYTQSTQRATRLKKHFLIWTTQTREHTSHNTNVELEKLGLIVHHRSSETRS